ncbi:MAG: glycosyltransferase family 39 protein, partial [Zwartia sp.]
MLLGVVLRLYGLEQKIVWHDEVATRVLAAGATMAAQMQGLYHAQVLTVGQVLQYQQVQQGPSVLALIADLAQHDPQHPPLYYVLAKVWVDFWGDSVYALRTLSVLFSGLGLLAMYWFVCELAASRRAALIAMLLMGVSPLFILYGQEAREYALWTLTLLLSSAALLRALRVSRTVPTLLDQNKLDLVASRKDHVGESVRSVTVWALSDVQRAWMLYGCSLLVAVYTSLSTLSLILVQVLYVAIVTRLQWSRTLHGFIVSLSAVGLLCLPWALNLLRNFEAFSASMAWSSVIVIPRTAVLRILSLNVTRNVFDFWPEVVQDQWLPIAASAACVTAIVAACVWVFRRTRRESRLYLLFLLVLPTSMLLLPDLLFGGIRSSNARYLMPVWLAVVAVLAIALDQALTLAARALERERSRGGQGVFLSRQGVVGILLCLAVLCLVALPMATNILHAQQQAPWTKSLSVSLPEVAQIINQSVDPLIVGNQERHHPGNLFALANLLKPETKLQLVPIALESSWKLPEHKGAVYLYSPTDQF